MRRRELTASNATSVAAPERLGIWVVRQSWHRSRLWGDRSLGAWHTRWHSPRRRPSCFDSHWRQDDSTVVAQL